MIRTKTALALAMGLALTLPLMADAPATAPAAATAAPKAAKVSKADPATEAAMKKSDCFTCHTVKTKLVGPAYKDVAKKYRNDPKAVEKLVLKVKNGGSGNWGQIPMSGHPNLKDDQIKAFVQWVLAQK